jgi:hypothetical protein
MPQKVTPCTIFVQCALEGSFYNLFITYDIVTTHLTEPYPPCPID